MIESFDPKRFQKPETSVEARQTTDAAEKAEDSTVSRRELLKILGIAAIGAAVPDALISKDRGKKTNKKEKGAATLRGSRESLQAENDLVEKHKLDKIRTDQLVRRMLEKGYLVRIPRVGRGFFVDEIGIGYKGNRDMLYTARPWVKKFLETEGARFSALFPNARFKVTALTRSLEYQKWLQKHNDNASSRSTHPTGATIDISKFLSPNSAPAKKWLPPNQLAYIRRRLLELEKSGKILATEEKNQATFHILVTPDY